MTAAAHVAPAAPAAACSSASAAAASFALAHDGARRCADGRRRSRRRLLWPLPAHRLWQQRHRLPWHTAARGDAMVVGGARGAGCLCCCLPLGFGSSGIACPGTRRCEAMRWPWAAPVAPAAYAAACSSALAAAASSVLAHDGARRRDDSGGARGAGCFCCCLLLGFGSSGIVCPGTRRCEAMRWWSAALVAPAASAAACPSALAAAAPFALARGGARRCDGGRRRPWRRLLLLLPAPRLRQQRHRLPWHTTVRCDAMMT